MKYLQEDGISLPIHSKGNSNRISESITKDGLLKGDKSGVKTEKIEQDIVTKIQSGEPIIKKLRVGSDFIFFRVLYEYQYTVKSHRRRVIAQTPKQKKIL